MGHYHYHVILTTRSRQYSGQKNLCSRNRDKNQCTSILLSDKHNVLLNIQKYNLTLSRIPSGAAGGLVIKLISTCSSFTSQQTCWKAFFIRRVDMTHISPEVKERVFCAWHSVLYVLINAEKVETSKITSSVEIFHMDCLISRNKAVETI